MAAPARTRIRMIVAGTRPQGVVGRGLLAPPRLGICASGSCAIHSLLVAPLFRRMPRSLGIVRALWASGEAPQTRITEHMFVCRHLRLCPESHIIERRLIGISLGVS